MRRVYIKPHHRPGHHVKGHMRGRTRIDGHRRDGHHVKGHYRYC